MKLEDQLAERNWFAFNVFNSFGFIDIGFVSFVFFRHTRLTCNVIFRSNKLKCNFSRSNLVV